MKEAKKAVRGSGRVSFLARLDAIKKMIEEGHPLLSIYQEYEKDFGFSYSQFVKYVHKFIRSKQNASTELTIRETEKVTNKEPKHARTRTPDEPAFISSPTPRDDLIHPKPKG